ncbi:hypothetical protein [Paenibacillus sp. FSL R5-0473]|uniref:hypothetical protein n=1 Tax=Paenibacillus sp. FSL R5-0473 TaxID=2921642 RepID=UPI0030F59371
MNSATTVGIQDGTIIGAKALGKQVYKIMPTYDLLLEQLKEIRVIASKQSHDQNQPNELNKQDFNNTVGIFGPRGTGKSSALYTLRDKLSQNKFNILLPLIEPDNFGENTKIIGSIVGLLCEEGRKLLQLLKKVSVVSDRLGSYFNNGILKPNNPLKQIMDETIEYHLYTEQRYRDILGQNYADLATHIRKSERLLIPDIEFKKKLMILIDTIIFVKKYLIDDKQNKNVDLTVEFETDDVLIYIFIDDIDLKTSKTRELMDALLQYTNHPNIITVLSGDYEILKESLTLALLQDEPLQELGLKALSSLKVVERGNDTEKTENFTILKRKTDLAHEYLKKIIPPARRHQLVKWNEKSIPKFGFDNETLLDQLVKLLGEWSIFSYMDKGKNAISWSYRIFDERPRGIINAFYQLNQLLNAKQDKESKMPEKHFQLVKAFVDTLILSNTKLLPQQEFIYEEFLIWGSDAKSSNIQYDVLGEMNNKVILEKETEDLRVVLYVISELVRKLLPDISHESESYFNWRKQVMNDLLIQPDEIKLKIKNRQKSETETDVLMYYLNRNQYSDFRLFFLVEAIAVFAEPEISSLLAELISNTHLKLYYKTRWDSNDAQAQDEFVINTIHTLLLQEDEMRNTQQEEKSSYLLETLYHHAYYNSDTFKSKLANFCLNLLESLCAETAEVVKAERQFKLIMNEWDTALKKAKEGEDNPIKWSEYMDLQIKRSLFLNSIISITKMKSIDYKFKENSSDIGHTLSVINRKSEKTGKVPEAVYSTLENRIKNFAKEIRTRFSQKEMTIVIDELDLEVQDYFLNSNSGVSFTKYDEAKFAFTKILNTNHFKLYSTNLGIIERLSQNNRVYYGRQEAAILLPILKNASKFSTENFTDLEKVTLQQYAVYVGANQTETTFNEYEKAKKFIKEKLKEAHSQLQKKTLMDIQGYNFNVDDMESDKLSNEAIDEINNDDHYMSIYVKSKNLGNSIND